MVPASDSIPPEADAEGLIPGSSVQASAKYIDPTINPGLQAFAQGAADNPVSAPSNWPDFGFDNNPPNSGAVTDPNEGTFLSGISATYQQSSAEDVMDSCSYWGGCPSS